MRITYRYDMAVWPVHNCYVVRVQHYIILHSIMDTMYRMIWCYEYMNYIQLCHGLMACT